MVTKDIFENLKNLQDILVEKYDLEKKVADAPKQLTTQDELLARLKKEYISYDTEYKAIKDKVLSLHAELEEAIKSRESGEKGMDNITTHREYEALDKQITEATAKENDLRKELQKEEKNQEELNETLKNYEEMINSQEAELNQSKESLDKQIQSYNDQLSELNAKENEISPNLDQEILFKFQRIIQRNTEGIVAVKNGVCTGCHMILPAQFANVVHEGENIMFCPYCSRILFYEEADEDMSDTYFNFDIAGSLADDLDGEDEEYDDEDYERENKELYRNEFGTSDDDDEDDKDEDDEDDVSEDEDDDSNE